MAGVVLLSSFPKLLSSEAFLTPSPRAAVFLVSGYQKLKDGAGEISIWSQTGKTKTKKTKNKKWSQTGPRQAPVDRTIASGEVPDGSQTGPT